MSKRRKIIVGNWKMNGRLTAGLTLVKDLVDKSLSQPVHPFDIVVCPPAPLIWPIAEALMGSPILLGGQDCHQATHGAYTGNISAGMLADLGCRYVILGHSERRTQHNETNELIAAKVDAAHTAGLVTVLCVGETQEQRASGHTESVIEEQLRKSLPTKFQPANLVVGYEPVWAIGSGQVPELEDIQMVHRVIRKTLGVVGEAVQVIYGGSVAPNNAGPILSDPEIDGVLVGSASLNADGFWAIAEKAR